MSNTAVQTATTTDVAVIPGTEIKPAPVISQEIVAYEQVDATEKQEIEAIIGEINLDDRSSIMFFGSKTQERMSSISEKMLEGVKNKDLGQAGNSLNDMVTAIKGFDIDELDPNRKQGFFERLFGKAKPVVQFLNRYEDVRKQIDRITDNMEGHKTQLLTDVVTLDKLYDANLDFFHKLELYIAAGEEKLLRLENTEIPALVNKAEANNEDMLAAQALRDLRSARDDLERRVHDLRLTRQVAMQSLPSIRLVQENDKTLINKINSTLINTVPLWKNQLAQAVTIFRMSDAAETVKSATDLTNDLLESNADNLRMANQEVRKQMERGVFDVASVRKANNSLIATINDSLQIAEEGKSMRAKAENEIKEMESELRQALISAKSKGAKATAS
ncbi:MAG: Tellurite resistance protein [uncultured Thiotrichaceae bacterium]|uniref:Tellurite resistance protein n=1 Tax=uncultured Thiotrichaceae bacterium TaxID=298394 RepID=A0A6S6SE15_9GAMM|nr:MAG: Tellurite resistance protein [uncultured Thiotrichaceae bacterium]